MAPRVARGLAALSALAATAVLWLSACPPKELLIKISAEGIGYVVKACQKKCATPCCALEAGQKDSPRPLAFQFSLLTRDGNGARTIRARSPCIDLMLACGDDFEQSSPGYCMKLQINDLVEEHLSAGLGFDGMDPSETELVMTIHRAPAQLDAQGQEIPDTAATTACIPEHLFACATLQEKEDRYDIVCAACDGQPPVVAREFDLDEVPCFGHCFAKECQTLLADAIANGL